ncbi:EamA family transporter [Thalassomonas haliotis]|uniref:EamA family transporter n=1 Tax=Thalassomonas haliotis TaxID=485448 RepID=A0ABY7VFW0_9GAMM|nr:EamA family transporter [Thalassomonas haliotis]WDE11798.1 EamA family transporter [Thalassomonas haliotis]
MLALFAVSLLWAFSFGLIKGELTGIPPALVAFIRLGFCFILFMPLALMAKKYRPNLRLVLLGSIQFGVMYLAYIASYQYLPGYLVAVFTIFTPLYVMLFDALLTRRFNAILLLPVLLSIFATAVIVFKMPDSGQVITGFAILQLANLAFAFGQVAYKHYCATLTSPHKVNMASMYLGAMLLTALAALPQTIGSDIVISERQWAVLVYLGLIASGLGFFLWNLGARQVSAPLLAIMNNAYVPLAVLLALTLFNESAEITRLLVGGGLILASLYWAQQITQRQQNKVD